MLVVGWLIFSIVVGIGASGLGRSGFGWFVLAVVITPLLAVILLFLLPARTQAAETLEREDRVKCPQCAEPILREAKVCRFCGYKIQATDALETARSAATAKPRSELDKLIDAQLG
jgi:hypothetical protein